MIIGDKQKKDEWANVMNSLAESVLEMSDEEILEDIEEEGDSSQEIKQIMQNAIATYRKTNLLRAREQYDKRLASIQNVSYEIPKTSDEKRSLIESMLGSMSSQGSSAITLQYRDYESLPDEDLDGVLQQLFALKSIEESEE